MLHDANPLLILSLVLVAGTFGGAVSRRLKLPSVTGQILVGVLMGPSVLHVFEHRALTALQPFTHFALGLMAVAVGSHLHLRKLRNAKKRLSLLVLFEAVLTPLAVFLAVSPLLSTWRVALLVAALSVSTAPATILAIVKESQAKGAFVKTLIAGVALNNIACISLFEVARTVSRAAGTGAAVDLGVVLIAPLRQLAAAGALGVGAGAALILATRNVVRPERLTTASMIAILLTVGLGNHLGISVPLSGLFLGMALANLTPEKEEIGHEVFANFEGAIFAVFFTLAGMELVFEHLVAVGGVALVAFVARASGKYVAAHAAMRLAGATRRIRENLGIALVPQAGLALGLVLLVTSDPAFAATRGTLLAVCLTLVTLNELVGPILTRRALHRSGDAGKDRARVIDFIHEENIVTKLRAATKEEAIEKLVDVLIETNHLVLDRDRLLRQVLDRERGMSTCVGDGLAIPHGELDGGAAMLGAIGISREGLDFETPDGRPVHCIILLATPASQRDRHLEVLAALARAVSSDHAIRDQLYAARSAAHAYELLHVYDESEDYNRFLEDAESA